MPMTRMMKDSGIEWIGEIPENWSIQKYKNFASSKMGETILASDTVEEGIPVYSATQDEKVFGFVKTSNTLLHKNDIVIPARGNSIGCATIVKDDVATCTQTTICSRNIHNISTSYLYYCCWGLKEWWFNYDGSAIPQITVKQVNNNLLPVPTLSEQQKIAAFLDEKCGAIDEIISKTEQSIEEYKKLKQSVITKAVTKGIRSNRPMQDSNIEWIGEIPTDWEIKKFRNILKERTEKNVPIKSTERLSLSIDLGVTLYAEKTTNLDRFKDDFEQYKIAHEGDLVMNSMNMIIGAVGVSKYYGCVSPVYYTWYDETPNHTTAKYCEYLLRCKTIKKVLFALGRGIYAIERGDDRVNTCRLKISRDDLKNLKLPLPSLDEQAEIINYLDEKCAEIDTLVEKKQQFLAEMANYKKSLIYEYVTGKKEVA